MTNETIQNLKLKLYIRDLILAVIFFIISIWVKPLLMVATLYLLIHYVKFTFAECLEYYFSVKDEYGN
jgi:hypothetical protein